MSGQSDDLSPLEQAWPFIMRMLQRRGYGVEGLDIQEVKQVAEHQKGEVRVTLLPRNAESEGKQPIPLGQVPPAGQRLVILFTLNSRIGVKNLRELHAYMKSQEPPLHNAIIFSSQPPTKPTVRDLRAYEDKGVFIQVMTYAEHKFDLLAHRLVDTPFILTEAQLQARLKFLGRPKHEMPRLTSTEAVARYLGLREGQGVIFSPNSELHVVFD